MCRPRVGKEAHRTAGVDESQVVTAGTAGVAHRVQARDVLNPGPLVEFDRLTVDLECCRPGLKNPCVLASGRSRVACEERIEQLGGRVFLFRPCDLWRNDERGVQVREPSDYKAANLVFGHDGPVLVDPDNGGREPRLFDLALALVLFHHECPTAPDRMLTAEEWAAFASAYLVHVSLTEQERALWPAAIDHVLWEEGTWALEDAEDSAWANPRDRSSMLDLARATPERYPLP